MPNFDALRSAIIGPLEYICRPKEKPAALLGLWTLGDGVTTDLSRYGGSCNLSFTPTNTDEYGFPLATFSGKGKEVVMSLGTTLDMGKDWSWEGFFRDSGDRPYSMFTIPKISIRAGSHDSSDAKVVIYVDGSNLVKAGSWRNPHGILHRAVQYTASDTTIRVYKNGSLQASLVQDLTGYSSSILTYSFNETGGNATVWGIGNLRVCQKALGTSTTFPTPTGLYTGYEPL